MNWARLTLLITASALLNSDSFARDLKTLNGDVFKNITVTKREATGVQITHDDGVIFLDFRNLAEADQKEFGFDPAVYVAGQKEKIEAEKRRREQALAAQQAAAAARKAAPATDTGFGLYRTAPDSTTQNSGQSKLSPVYPSGVEVYVESPGFKYGPYQIEGRGFSNTIPPSLGGKIVPRVYPPWDGTYWGPTEIRRR